MDAEGKSRIFGAFLVGVALVGGAYTLANFGAPRYAQPAAVAAVPPPPRVAVAVTDADNNGIEDWRDQYFTSNTTIKTTATSSTYEEPSTLTGQIGVEFIQGILENRIYGSDLDEQTINSTLARLEAETSDFLYDTQDVSIFTNWEPADIRNYANIMASAIITNDLDLEGELDILLAIITREETDRIAELEAIAGYYETLRDEALRTPVPAILAKQHLDLINTYHAMVIDIRAMTQVTVDPIRTLMRIRKHGDNSLGLQLALDNMYRALLPYANEFTVDDAGVIFNLFAIRQRI